MTERALCLGSEGSGVEDVTDRVSQTAKLYGELGDNRTEMSQLINWALTQTRDTM